MKISKTDYNLIKALQEDGSLSYSDLADKLGITAKTVAKRLERLLSAKVISIRAQPNPFKLGLSATALLGIKADPSKIEQICEKLAEYFYVNLVQTVFGRLDILAIVYFPNWEMLHEFIKSNITHQTGLINTETFIRAMVQKTYYGWWLEMPEF